MSSEIASKSTSDVPTDGIVSILCSDYMHEPDLSLARLVEFSGLSYESISLRDNPLSSAPFLSRFIKRKACLALSCETLVHIQQNRGYANEFKSLLEERIAFLLIYGISPGETSSGALRNLTDGIVKGITSFSCNEYEYVVSTNDSGICQHFSGLSFGPINNEVDYGLDVAYCKEDICSLVTVNEKPLFIKIENGDCSIFLLSTSQILDIRQRVSGITSATKYFSTMIPIVMFLRHVFKDRCWHNDVDKASLIIDDPLLKRRYGFLDYELLLKEMDDHDFFTNIAFIPWNYKRTSKLIANVMKRRTDRFSVCIHGYDHTSKEFGITDSSELDRRVKLATKRMTTHEDINKLSFDSVMVFPQGVFSTDSMRVLKSNNYLAAVNSDVLPIDSPSSIRVCDLLEPAVMNYYTFPLFYRRYPITAVSFAFDLFFGKPALIVAHHDYFRNGYERLAGFVDSLNSLTQHLEWRGLASIVKNAYLIKFQGNDIISAKLYSPNSIITNTSDSTITYVISKKESGEIPIKSVNINGNEASYELKNDVLNVVAEVAPRHSINVVIVYQETHTDIEETPGIYENAKVSIRRRLSEIRDNYLSRQPFLLACVNRLKRYL